jgi:hypothetical protein
LDKPQLAARRLAELSIIPGWKKKPILQTEPPVAMTDVAVFSRVGIDVQLLLEITI